MNYWQLSFTYVQNLLYTSRRLWPSSFGRGSTMFRGSPLSRRRVWDRSLTSWRRRQLSLRRRRCRWFRPLLSWSLSPLSRTRRWSLLPSGSVMMVWSYLFTPLLFGSLWWALVIWIPTREVKYYFLIIWKWMAVIILVCVNTRIRMSKIHNKSSKFMKLYSTLSIF